jgi:hypothetical protein
LKVADKNSKYLFYHQNRAEYQLIKLIIMATEGMNSDVLNEDQQGQLLMMMLIQQHQQIAMMGMGKIMNPSTQKVESDLNQAKFAIDTLNAFQKYTEGNLPEELKRYLQETLTNLRLNFVEEKKKSANASSAATDKSEETSHDQN